MISSFRLLTQQKPSFVGNGFFFFSEAIYSVFQLRKALAYVLSLHIYQFLKNFIRYGNDLGVSLETSLSGNHVR
ncbi:hypothetical protein HMPREF6123_1728, partial [Oribacterium sinus F0268]